jgi:hypothetical protein
MLVGRAILLPPLSDSRPTGAEVIRFTDPSGERERQLSNASLFGIPLGLGTLAVAIGPIGGRTTLN